MFWSESICFEKDSYGRELIKCNWKKNGSLGRLSVFGKADVRTLLSLTEEDVEDAIVLVDIEGDEFDLFEPDVFSKLKKCTIVVEIHNWVDGFLNKYKNFLWLANDYFKISRISPRDRLTTNIPELRDFPDENRLLLIFV